MIALIPDFTSCLFNIMSLLGCSFHYFTAHVSLHCNLRCALIHRLFDVMLKGEIRYLADK